MNGSERTSSSTKQERRIPRGTLLVACVIALGFALPVAPAHAKNRKVVPPPVPGDIEVEAPNEAFLVGHAVGTQNYICLPSPSAPGVAWTLFTPQANLFQRRARQIQTHFFSPNPFEGGTVRATWQDSQDTSTVWGRAVASSSDPEFVAPNAIPWLKVEIVGSQEGPTGGGKLTETTYIQRLNTVGGAAPSTGCSLSSDIGKRAYVPYAADYFFFKDASDDE